MVSIIICTYNRSSILKLCLQRLAEYSNGYSNQIEIILVDNNSSDETKQVVKEFSGKKLDLPIHYIFEKEQGLSVARNTGAKNAKYEWLFYLDDDGLIINDTLSELFYTISNFNFDIFGGAYIAYYLEEKPKWLSSDFGTKKVKAKTIGILNEDNIEGGIMVIKKSILEELNYFNVGKGMIGNKIRYSEETDLIKRASMKNYQIGFNPNFKMEHIVGVHKYFIKYHFKSIFALGRDKSILGEKLSISLWRTLCLLPFRIIKYFLKYLSKKDFYFQNFLWYSFNNSCYLVGFFYGKLIK